MTISEAMLLADDGAARIVQTVFEPEHDGAAAVAISSADGDAGRIPSSWLRHADRTRNRAASPRRRRQACAICARNAPAPVDAGRVLRRLQRRGVQFGDDFHTVLRVWRGAAQAMGEVVLTPASAASSSDYGLHPLLLDGCLQVLAAALPAETG